MKQVQIHIYTHTYTHIIIEYHKWHCTLQFIVHMRICSDSLPTSFLWVHSWQLYDSFKATSTACTASTQWSRYTHLYLPVSLNDGSRILVYRDRLGALVIRPTALLLSPSDDVMLYMDLPSLISDTQVHSQWKLKRTTEPRLLVYNTNLYLCMKYHLSISLTTLGKR
jgi:hypothetical protein